MREIKFRAWDTRPNMSSKRIDEALVKDGKLKKMVYFGLGRLDEDLIISSMSYLEGDYKLMQFTGLKDKNEKEIYEGDVVKYKHCGWDCPEEEFEYMEVKWEKDLEDGFCGFEIPASWAVFKVIGNIYENPELLKEKK
jgi:uncharacterized phage protein (TIGR01671 family)